MKSDACIDAPLPGTVPICMFRPSMAIGPLSLFFPRSSSLGAISHDNPRFSLSLPTSCPNKTSDCAKEYASKRVYESW
jgi:hypothetical protein